MRVGLVLLCLLLVSHPGRAGAEEELIGLWGYETSFGPTLQGPLSIERADGGWRATVVGLQGAVEVAGDQIVAVFPEGAGKFRGRLAGGRIEGFFIRRGVHEDPAFPVGSSQPYASPLILERTGGERWSADVHPLKVQAKLYLKIFREADGRVLGAFRDPNRNDNGGASRFLVTVEGDKVAFSQPNEAGGFDVHFKGVIAPGALKVNWPNLGGEIEMRPVAVDDQDAFLPRLAGAPPYVYRKPEVLNDGWNTARGRDVGIEEAAFERVVRRIIEQDPATRSPSLVHSILIARRGKLVLEEYFFGFGRETAHDLRSAGKTFASVMLGAAKLKGVDIAPGSKIYEVLAERGPFANPDPRKAKITLGHLMTHASGLACNDNDEASPGNEGVMQTQKRQPDWWKYTLDLPMAHEPGTRYAYCSANINLAGGALTVATKRWLPEFFDETVAKPLGFGRYHWNLTPTEDGYLGGGAFLRPRDLLKVGQAYLDGGVWRGRRIVGKDWIAESTVSRIKVTPETTGYSAEEFGNYYGGGEDAYAWHVGKMRAGERTVDTYAATGNGGQVLIVAPRLDMVVVFTGGNYRQGGIWGRWGDELIGAEIAASIND